MGTIKDYPATGLMTGCGNLYFYPASRVSSSGDAYIFLARGDGSNAWMNLNGRDVRLRQVKSKAKSQRPQAYLYSFGALRISVMFEEAGSVPAGETDATSKMKITMRLGRAVRIVHAVGGSDC